MSVELSNQRITETQQMAGADRQRMMTECYLRLVGAAHTLPEESDTRRVLTTALTKLIDYVLTYDTIEFSRLIGPEGFWLSNSKDEEVVIILSAFKNLITLYNSHSRSFDRLGLHADLNELSKRSKAPASRNRITPPKVN